MRWTYRYNMLGIAIHQRSYFLTNPNLLSYLPCLQLIRRMPRTLRNAEKKLAREQRKLSRMQKGSNNRNKQRFKVAKLHEKISNQRKNFLHKQSRQITNAYDCVCIEDLDMKAMSRSLKFGKSVSDNGWGMFTTFLRYKLEEQIGRASCRERV